MIRVNKFFCCLKLETGGYVIGGLSLFSNALMVLFGIIAVLLLSIFSCSDIREIYEKDVKLPENFEEACSDLRIPILVVTIIIILLSIGFALIGYLCVKGTEKREHSRLKPMIILLGISTVLCSLNLLQIVSKPILAIVFGLGYGLLYAYLFVVMYSLYSTFKEEHEQGAMRYHSPEAKV